MTTEKNFDILVVGELNIDLILDGIQKAPAMGKEQRASEMTLTMGSSSAIFAVNASGLGSNVTFCGKAGTDSFGEFMISSLDSFGVNTDTIITDDSCKTGATIIFHYQNDRMMVTHPGAMEQMTVGEVPDKLFKQSRHLHVSAIFFQTQIKNRLAELFIKAKKNGMTTSLDLQWDPDEKWDIDLEKILPLTDFFMPNETELLQITQTDQLQNALQKLNKFDTYIVVKRGVNGAILQQNGETTESPAYDVPGYIDAVGAGDSFNAGFIHAFLSGENLERCLKLGNLTAAVSTTAAGGTGAIQSFEQVIEMETQLTQRS
jgi:sugar/nucleoside kinase (ribokinase family)